jgi:mRNA interferase MazF
MIMTPADPPPSPGSIVLMDFSPALGSEQGGLRPALVVSQDEMHEMTRRAIVCPITRNIQPWPTKVFLPSGLAAEGAVLVDQVRSVDRGARILRKLGQAPEAVLLQVRRKLVALMGIEMAAGGSDG